LSRDRLRLTSNDCKLNTNDGAYPPKIAKTLGVSIEDATKLFNNYHKVLYPGITEYREKYVLPTTERNGKIHLGLGFNIASNDVQRNSRTLMNAIINNRRL